jgi:hypothetical protein
MEVKMAEKDHLYILWTTDNPITVEKMIFMYGYNALKNGWWKKVTLIIWGASASYIDANQDAQKRLEAMMSAGMEITACKACADQLGVTDTLESLGIEVKYWGTPLTQLLKDKETLLSV